MGKRIVNLFSAVLATTALLASAAASAQTAIAARVTPAFERGAGFFDVVRTQGGRYSSIPDYAPPPPSAPAYDEPVPPPRRGQVWVQGHWEWQGDNYYWVHGKFEAARPGYYYEQPLWRQQGNRWAFRGGAWTRDNGLRNRNDGDPRVPDTSNLDSDGDGVPNRFDRFPADPMNH